MDDDEDCVASECENIFNNIQNLDLFQIKANLDVYSPNYIQSDETERLRLVLKKSLLEEIVKIQNIVLKKSISNLFLNLDTQLYYSNVFKVL